MTHILWKDPIQVSIHTYPKIWKIYHMYQYNITSHFTALAVNVEIHAVTQSHDQFSPQLSTSPDAITQWWKH